MVTIELRDLAHDIVNNLLTGFPAPALRQAIEQVIGADAVIAVTPLYSGSYNGLFKSFFDVLDPDALRGQAGADRGHRRHGPALARAGARDPPAVQLPARGHRAHRGLRGHRGLGLGGPDGRRAHRPDRAGRCGELAALVDQRAPAAEADPYASMTPFDQLLHGH